MKLHRYLLRSLFVFLWATWWSSFIAVEAFASVDRFNDCAPGNKFIEISVTVKKIAATASEPERLVWVLAKPPAQVIQLPPGDTVLRGQILDLFQQIADAGVDVGVREGGNPQVEFQLETQLLANLTAKPNLKIRFPSGLKTDPQASDTGQTFRARICLDYPDGGEELRKVELRVVTKTGEQTPVAGIQPFKLSNASAEFTGSAGDIPVSLAYSQHDLADARRDASITSDDEAKRRVESELLAVAAFAFKTSVDEKLLDQNGTPLVDVNEGQNIADRIETRISRLYNLNLFDPKIEWANVRPRVGVRDVNPGSPWIVSITGVELAQSVDVQVLKSPTEADLDTTNAEAKFAEKRRVVRDELRKELPNFASKPGRVITTDNIAQDQQRLLGQKKLVKSVSDMTSKSPQGDNPPQTLFFTVFRPLKGEKSLGLKLGVSYSPEESVTGSASGDENNFLGFGETAKLSYSGGPQTQKIRFNFDRPFPTSGSSGWHIKSFNINVQYFADKDQRFANLTPEEIESREAGSEARFSFNYDSFSVLDHAATDCLGNEDRKRTRFYLLATPLLNFRDVNIKDDDVLFTVTKIDPSLLPQARTQTTTLSLDGNLGFTHDFRELGRPGLGLLNFAFQGRAQRAIDLFGGDYRYNKLGGTLTSEVFFGFTSSKDFFVRHNHVMGTSTRGTPVWELFRLGGPNNVRGLEEGEFIGRKLSADQFEFGINTLLIWHMVSRKPVKESLLKDPCADEQQSALPIDISNSYVKIFYDRGRISDPDSFPGSPDFKKVASGYGIAFEIRRLGGQNINLSIGYAHSPQSELHKKGTLYTGVSLSISQ